MSIEPPKNRSLRFPRIACAGLLEPMVRLMALSASFFGKDPEGVEMRLRGWLLGGNMGWRIGRNVRFVGPLKKIHLGQGVIFYGNAYVNAGGPQGHLTVGAASHIDQFCVLYAQGDLQIGESCAIASGVSIYTQTNKDASHDGTPVARQPTHYAPVVLGDGCWLGAGCSILPGITLGSNVHVGAGAVVTKSFEADMVVAGVPARSLHSRPS